MHSISGRNVCLLRFHNIRSCFVHRRAVLSPSSHHLFLRGGREPHIRDSKYDHAKVTHHHSCQNRGTFCGSSVSYTFGGSMTITHLPSSQSVALRFVSSLVHHHPSHTRRHEHRPRCSRSPGGRHCDRHQQQGRLLGADQVPPPGMHSQLLKSSLFLAAIIESFASLCALETSFDGELGGDGTLATS